MYSFTLHIYKTQKHSCTFIHLQAKERPTEGQIIAAGPGKLHPHTGIRIANPVTTGDSVLYGKFDGVQLLYNDDPCQMIRDDDVMLYYQGTSMTNDSVQPCRDYVLIELEADATETASGIVVAAAVMRDQVPCEGIVKKVGEGRMTSKGELATPPVKPGDRVKFKDYGGNDVMIENKAFSLVRMVDILCTVEKWLVDMGLGETILCGLMILIDLRLDAFYWKALQISKGKCVRIGSK